MSWFAANVVPFLAATNNVHRRHLDSGQLAASAELYERMNAEFAAEVEKMKEEAQGRKSEGGKIAGRGRPKQDSQIIDEAINPNARRTDATLARAAGTNRRYREVAAKLPQDELEALRDGKKKMPDVIREQKRATIKANQRASRLRAELARHESKV